MKNRLRLDFTLQTAEERLKFVESYLPTLQFEPNEHELETLSDYLLWGKNQQGLNSQQEGDLILKEWAPSANVESLESLLEIPGFQEAKFRQLNQTHYKTKRIVFDREAALKTADPYFQTLYEQLFEEIDKTELLLNYYEIYNGKRQKPPRDSLLQKFSEDERFDLQMRAEVLTPKAYLKMRHYLVDLRTEQYSYRDAAVCPIFPKNQTITTENTLRIGTDIDVAPAGLNDNTKLSQKIFQDDLNPSLFNQRELKKIMERLDKKENGLSLNFCNPQHLVEMYKNKEVLEEAAEQDKNQLYGSARAVLDTLKFYEEHAKLNEIQRTILQMKIENQSNMRIADSINNEYGTSYNDNYISTIYRQKILGSISKAANLHLRTLENLIYPENFKKCKDCGRVLLRDPELFTRQKKSADGFSPRCKACEKKRRNNG